MAAMVSQTRRFVKMHGAGNDFVLFDLRGDPLLLSEAQIRALADRHTGIGCDQLILLHDGRDADVFMRIHNADGGRVAACGNATRCVGALLMADTGADRIAIETEAGLLHAEAAGEQIAVDMGPPRLDWQAIPLARAMTTDRLDFQRGPLADPAAVSMGNPHLVFFVDDAASVDLASWGPAIETDPLFPERVNVSVLQVEARDGATLRVWERGAGLTLACGTAACAALVAAVRRGLMDRQAAIALPGGTLSIDWRADDHVWMTGPVATVFTGEVAL
ncbi:MAG: diaminopimelate epimerase [Rhodothalassiaceae bacterium]